MTNQPPGSRNRPSTIQLRGIRVHNLKNIDLDIPLNQLNILCGVSGSGKTSLAFDTLYAEGQRRYIETLSTAARQHLKQLPKPDADHVSNVPPAIALKQNIRKTSAGKGTGSSVATESGIYHYLQLLFASQGQVICPGCRLSVTSQSPESVLAFLQSLPDNIRYQICYPIQKTSEYAQSEIIKDLLSQGMTRAVINHELVHLAENSTQVNSEWDCILVILDRLNTKTINEQRVLDSLEIAFQESSGQAAILIEQQYVEQHTAVPFEINHKKWFRFNFSTELICPQCSNEFIFPEPQLFNFYSPRGACPNCQGSGSISQSRTLEICPDCFGSRLNRAALAVHIQQFNIDQLCRLSVLELTDWMEKLNQDLNSLTQQKLSPLFREINDRLTFLNQLGVHYLTLNRAIHTLSGGERQRIAMTSILSSNLVNTLYILDEPSSGLHPADNSRVISAIQKIRELKNTLVIVEHAADFIKAADHIIELGPAAGSAGGEVVFEGSYQKLMVSETSPTSQILNSPATETLKSISRSSKPELLILTGVNCNNLKDITVSFPLGQLCIVTGISGSGKSSLIEQTLFPTLAQALTDPTLDISDLPCQSITGTEQIDEVILLDQSLVGQSSRSVPATYLNLFDDIRAVFAQTADAKLRNFTSRDFSFNSKNGGRCAECKGTGVIEIDLQFLAELTMTCPECHGKRYQREILEIKYRKLNVAEVLELTVDEAFLFFRGQPVLQKKLKQLKDVGLGYLPLGQSVSSLSGGECQRLKLAAYLTTSSRNRTLFLMNEPSSGLHSLDIRHVLNCFEHLLTAGHSIIMIEHNLDMIRVADHIIDLGPDAGEQGGSIVAVGTPAEIAQHPTSYTGAALKKQKRA